MFINKYIVSLVCDEINDILSFYTIIDIKRTLFQELFFGRDSFSARREYMFLVGEH